ncbi:UNVERIFIED_ORG: AlpA family transcriptional regulator [Zoogloea ramigera]|uniref:AlpA family phage regulatory protein n=1 Tax=Duganella zoogloeoides TaxID=75659 RepID=A0ABZ0Y4E7_9BURK|nr:AlpA family phage regulatory protein [Duganella zoogloeoides]WQH06247.1 AlpA family phage regulatory protein [Duganella zoogloeoides]
MTAPSEDRRSVARPASLCLVRLPEVKAICGLSRSSIYLLIRDGRFPPPVAISGRARGWVRHEVERWVAERIRASRQQ